jgi:hypothetical protein
MAIEAPLRIRPREPVRRELGPRTEPRAPAQPDGFDRRYWLAHCEGYRVDAADGRLGFVEGIEADASGAPLLVVRAGRLGRRLLLIPASEAAFIVPRAQRVWLRSPVAIAATKAA